LFGTIKPHTSRAAIDGILAMLERGELSPPQQVPAERDLARRLGTRRRVVRYATQTLIEHGVFEIRRHNRVFVRLGADEPEVARQVRAVL